ncbi:winged helix-turn-helix domain-containing protein [Bacillus sp. 3103sda1]|uniref:ArsR/SmtB family transcription factor n=1 Tax=Bacillus sp. 3103sda1 TaxID=2953808 RepID=UPI0020A015F9|nr:winged helix-turn-helix domain-containing protein [Bacillus sp. 3103sda1]MCP1124298.1 winged helix-turn-helix domain-containing protein [Bacillus sp. 3103sda1]
MKVINLNATRETYSVQIKHSILFEMGLGIAACTYYDFHHTFEKPIDYWKDIEKKLSAAVQKELQYTHKHNTWFALLQLLHSRSFDSLESFFHFLDELTKEELRWRCLPYIGLQHEDNRRKASHKEETAITSFIKACQHHKFFPAYIKHISSIDTSVLKRHLKIISEGWYETVIQPNYIEFTSMLERDAQQKRVLQSTYHPEELVKYITGSTYQPEPSIHQVTLIPQYVYRPWNVETTLPGIKVFYYPISDDNVSLVEDPYSPPSTLVHSYKALGDETRLKIIKLLTERDHSLQELTEKLKTPKTTLHHHLSLLRAARIINGKGSRYYIQLDHLTSLQEKLQRFLGKE